MIFPFQLQCGYNSFTLDNHFRGWVQYVMILSEWRLWLRRLARVLGREPNRQGALRLFFTLEMLENRLTPSGAVAVPTYIRGPALDDPQPQAGQLKFGNAFAPAGMQKAYGIDQLINNGDAGAGQTIALIDAYDNPDFSSSGTPGFATSDLHFFDTFFGLPDPTFVKVSQTGTTNYPGTDPNNGWEGEEALDVEWAHAIAPAAKIILVECNNSNPSNLDAGVEWAATPVANGGGGRPPSCP